MIELLNRLEQRPLTRVSTSDAPAEDVRSRHATALGCKGWELAEHLLGQVLRLELALEHGQVDLGSLPPDDMRQCLLTSTASLAELEPQTATEALLAAQMIGTQRLAMKYLTSAIQNSQSLVAADSCVLRATRLMRLFNEQAETMMKLKGKTGQQKVVVEHVTVNDGGQAIVGAVAATKVISPGGVPGADAVDPR